MVAPRRNKLLASRRRPQDDEGEDEGGLGPPVDDDSSSQPSLPSDLDEDADAEGSDASEVGTPNKNGFHKKEEGVVQPSGNGTAPNPAASAVNQAPFSPVVADTEAMLNGMKVSEQELAADEVDFENAGKETEQDTASAVIPPPRVQSLAERRRLEHEEYKKKRDADPAFVPNRGGFFMHDQRSSPSTQNGFKPLGRGRGRGRGTAPFSPLGHPHIPQSPTNTQWAHDLHETVTEEGKNPTENSRHGQTNVQQLRLAFQPQSAPPPNRIFSRTLHVGNIQLRVMMAGMKAPIVFSAVPVNQHTRLPHHRPPLRRDKPVRVSLPENPPRYIFPAIDRSFIFIPRALRPNQQGFHRGRGRGSFGYASGRTSVYGGSAYSPSIAMSRRSSFARDVGREAMASPAGSIMSRNRSVVMDAGRPVVRLPPAADMGMMAHQMPQQPFMHMHAPVVNLPIAQAYPLPQLQDPLSQESLPVTLPMHQPRPQKAVSVAGIESPGNFAVQAPQQQQQQPFHHQVPISVANAGGYGVDPGTYSQSRRPSHPSQHGTPLSQIPERAIHAQPFQPYPYPQPPAAFYPQQYPGPMYFYPSASMPPSMAGAAPFVPAQQQYPYMVAAPPPPPPPPSTGVEGQSAGQPPGQSGGMVAHESNGMVYYYDHSQLSSMPSTDEHGGFQPMSYPPAGGYVMPPPAVFYPPQ